MKKLLLIATLLLLYGCPSEDCFEISNGAEVYDLVKISPIEPQFRQGETITLKLDVPATNSYFGRPLNLVEQSGERTALLIFTGPNLFIGNELTFTKGSQGRETSWFGVIYNPQTDTYELEISITLNKLGTYNLDALHFIDFIGNQCNSFSISTSAEGTLVEDISFEVVP